MNNYYQPNYYNPYMNQPQSTLNGKMVDSIDVVKGAEVPLGGYGVFPKADFSEVYIKSWNQNGTTNIMAFKPYIIEEKKEISAEEILEKINSLETKIDNLIIPKKEVKLDAY